MLSINDLNYSTVRINTRTENGSSTGTGFIVRFAEQIIDGQYVNVPSIVTNKHVIEGAIEGTVRFHAANKAGKIAETQCEFTLNNFESLFFKHPDPDVDLCAIPVAIMHKLASKDNIKPYYNGLSMKQIPNSDQLNDFFSAEDIIVVGYPNGIWDDKNNLPIFRKGTLATLPSVEYKGNREFLIDCAIYPGSSGSPVISIKQLFNKQTFEPFMSINLLGVIFATYQHNAQGTFSIQNIPSKIVNTLVPNHLGLVLNSSRIHELNEKIKDYYSDTSPENIINAIDMKNSL